MAVAYVNGQAFDSSQLVVRFASMDEPFFGFKSISYAETEEVSMNYGIGQRAVSYGRGNITPEASITLSYDSFQSQIIDTSPNGRVQDRALEDLIVTYKHPDTNRIKTDVLRNCIITSPAVDANQNDKEFEVELTLITPEIVYGQSGA